MLRWIRSSDSTAIRILTVLLVLHAAAATTPSMVLADGPDGPPPPSHDEFLPNWTHLPFDPYPLWPVAQIEPVITRADVTDGHADLVADPFLFHEDGVWYLFFEAWIGVGRISLATSENGLDWTYDRMVIIEPWSLSYPYVFEWKGKHYIVLSVPTRNEVSLYRANEFPHEWTKIGPILTGRNYADASIFRSGNSWWMFAGSSGNLDCHLFYSDSLASGWTEHPLSPIVHGDPSKARPAGRVVCYGDGHILRFAQKCDVSYGQAVRAFSVTRLNRTQYQEQELPESPILIASGSGWNAEGMHTCDPWWNGDRWLASVDGCAAGGEWTIGIYWTRASSFADEQPWRIGREILSAAPPRPNPSSGPVDLEFHWTGEGGSLPIQISILDVLGHEIRRLPASTSSDRGVAAIWDGLDSEGRRAPPGVYFCRARAGASSSSVRLVIAR